MRFDALDSLRGVFALMVALVHLSALGHFFAWPLVRNAGFGVDFFFVLSGFVLMHAYGGRVGSAAQALDFLWRRVGRLYPLHLATLCVMLAIELGKWAVVRMLGLSAGEAPFSGT